MKNLYKALAKFQKEVNSIPKNSKGYGYDYAKLEDIIKVVTPTLHKNGLVVIQTIDTDYVKQTIKPLKDTLVTNVVEVVVSRTV